MLLNILGAKMSLLIVSDPSVDLKFVKFSFELNAEILVKIILVKILKRKLGVWELFSLFSSEFVCFSLTEPSEPELFEFKGWKRDLIGNRCSVYQHYICNGSTTVIALTIFCKWVSKNLLSFVVCQQMVDFLFRD